MKDFHCSLDDYFETFPFVVVEKEVSGVKNYFVMFYLKLDSRCGLSYTILGNQCFKTIKNAREGSTHGGFEGLHFMEVDKKAKEESWKIVDAFHFRQHYS